MVLYKSKEKSKGDEETILTKDCDLKGELIGELYVDDTVLITDPCYDIDEYYTTSYELRHGLYNCYATYKDGRVQSAYMVLSNCVGADEVLGRGEKLGLCGVDSWQLGIFLADKYKKDVPKEVYDKTLAQNFVHEEWKRPYTTSDNFFTACCNCTFHKGLCGVLDGVGFISNNGWRNGAYVPYLLETSVGVAGIKIDFFD